jgi:hypothetical protein
LDGRTHYEKGTLDKIQHEAARIVSGLTPSVSIQNLYKEKFIGSHYLIEERTKNLFHHIESIMEMFLIN